MSRRDDPKFAHLYQRADAWRAGKRSETPSAGPRPNGRTVSQKPRTEPLKTPADLPCVHRGRLLETVACKPCTSGGRDGADVWACAVHERAVLHNFTPRDASKGAVACVTCEDREPGRSPGIESA